MANPNTGREGSPAGNDSPIYHNSSLAKPTGSGATEACGSSLSRSAFRGTERLDRGGPGYRCLERQTETSVQGYMS